METPFFSIIIPALNEQKLLPRLLEDLKLQTWSRFECLVVDAGSSDKTPQIVTEAMQDDPRFVLIISDRKNPGFQRNLGASSASGNYLVFLDADGQIPDFFLEGLHYRLQQTPSDFFTNWAEPDGRNPRDKAFIQLINVAVEGGNRMGYPVAIAACIGFKREVFMKVGGFDPLVTYMEDVELVRRTANQGFTFAVYHDPIFTMSLRRLRQDGTLHLYRTMPSMAKQLFINQKNIKPIKSYPMLGGNYFKGRKKNFGKGSLAQYKEVLKLLKKMYYSRKQKVKQFLPTLFWW